MCDGEKQLDQRESTPAGLTRLGYLLIAYATLAIGIAGVFLPLLPATPFLLIAVWAGSRGSQRVHDWIFEQPRFARLINDWHEQGAVPLSAKWLATIMMIVSFLTLTWGGANWLLLLGMAIFFSCVGGFLWTRPNPLR
jgi:uncharacterized protein